MPLPEVQTLRRLLARAKHGPSAARRHWLRIRRGGTAALGLARGLLAYPAAWFGPWRPRDDLAAAVAELLMLGFHGANMRSFSARLLARQLRRGEVGGVFLVSQNIGTRDDAAALLRLFRLGKAQPLIAIDHEGGVVQRLTPAHGFTRLPTARDMARTLTPEEARQAYFRAGQELAALGFNVNLGPVLDLDDAANAAIGRPMRSFGTDPDRIAAYAEAFARGFADAGLLCAAKHFPGHGRSQSDSHHGVADITANWTDEELKPFARLIASPHCPAMIMTGHLRHDGLSPDGQPASVSAAMVTGLLRQGLGYRGVVITDDLDMDALRLSMGRQAAFVRAIAAGNDLIMIRNLFGYDPLLPRRALRWVRRAIAHGLLTEAQVLAAAERVRAARRQAWRVGAQHGSATPARPAPRT